MADILGEIFFAGIQDGSPAAVAVDTYEKLVSRFLSIIYSGVALAGTYYVFKTVIKIFRTPRNRMCESCTVRHVITGTLVYCGSVYAFIQAWKYSKNQLWIPCYVIAPAGSYFAVSSINNRAAMADTLGGIFFAGIQAGVGAALAVYTYENSVCPFCFFASSGVALAGTYYIFKSVIKHYFFISRAQFRRYSQWILGPPLTVYSSAASAYIGYHMGCRSSLPIMAFAAAGVYIANKGFRRIDGRPDRIFRLD